MQSPDSSLQTNPRTVNNPNDPLQCEISSADNDIECQLRVHLNERMSSPHSTVDNPSDFLNDSSQSHSPKSNNMTLIDGQVPMLPKGNKLFLLNIRGLVNKIDMLRFLLSKNEIDVLCVNETLCDSTISDGEVSISGLRIERKDRNRSGGGVALYISTKFFYIRRYEFENPDLEMICIQVSIPFQKQLIVFCIYRPPSNDASFFDKLESVLESAHCSCKSDTEFLVLGDLNCDYMHGKNSNLHSKLDFLMNTYSFTQVIDTPTRVTDRSKSVIDVVFTTHSELIIEHGCIHTSISDHYLIYVIRRLQSPKDKCTPNTVSCRSFKGFDKEEFQQMISTAEWPEIDETKDVNELWKDWKLIFTDIINKNAPKKTMRLRNKSHAWINSDIRSLMAKRDRTHDKFLALKNRLVQEDRPQQPLRDEVWKEYKLLRNKVNIALKDCKATYYKTVIGKHSGNSNKMWKFLRELLPNKKETLPYIFSIDDELCSDDSVIANAFNEFFIDSVLSLRNSLPNENENQCVNEDIDIVESLACSHSFDFSPVDEDFVINMISNLDDSKATGADDISIKFLKEGNPEIAVWITQFINLSFNTGVYPDDWKHAKICPIFKKGDRNICCNYRPISILNAASKLIERVAHKQLYEYIVQHNLLNKAQFGFRPGHSTGAAVGSMADDWLHAIDIGRIIAALFVDLKRAFDTVDPPVLLTKLKRKGASDLALRWFKSYLNNRKQQVEIRGATSNSKNLSLGVPQGSILGPLLFLIYIDDVVDSIKNGNVTMYADDTTLYVSGTSFNEIQTMLQEDVNSLSQWIKDNKLTLNVDKTKLMIIGSKQRLRSCENTSINIFYDGNPIERCTKIKCLGVIIDENILWHNHVDFVCKKVFAGLAVLRRIRPFVDNCTLKLLYMCIVQSQMDYCCEVWGNRFNMHTERITKLQKKGCKTYSRM